MKMANHVAKMILKSVNIEILELRLNNNKKFKANNGNKKELYKTKDSVIIKRMLIIGAKKGDNV